MTKNTITVSIILTFFSVFGHANSNIPKERDTGINNSQKNLEATLYIDNPKSVGNLISTHISENMVWADTTETSKERKVKRKKYKVWLTLINQPGKVEGYLYAVNDSSLVVSSTSEIMKDEVSATLSNAIAIANISKIKLRRKGSLWKGYIIGTSIGIGTGIILGAAGGGEGTEILAAAGMLGIAGSIIGTPIGGISGTKKYNISGNQEIFLNYQQELKTFSLIEEKDSKHK